jgi:predicted porin
LGVNAEFTITKTLKANFVVSNGEGYKKLQDEDGNQKIGGSLVFEPIKGLTTKIYMDSQPTTDSDAITTMALFAGYKASDWRLGAEYNKLNNGKKYSSAAVDHELDGLSFYATYVLNKKFEVYGRYDQLSSNTLTGGLNNWNIANDGSQVIAGIQYAPVKGLKFSLNYQDFSFDNTVLDNKSLVFLNAEFKL